MKYIKETRIAAPPRIVFAFHESPDALEKLIPPWENLRVVERAGSLKSGSRVILEGRKGPMKMRWVALHTEYDPPHLFVDVQESGPFASWTHRHFFLDDGQGGTLLRDEIDYTLPLGWLGRLLLGGMTRRQLDRMFTYRHEVTCREVMQAADK